MRRLAILCLGLSLAWPLPAQDRVAEHLKLAEQLMRRGRDKDARLELEAALSLDPQRSDVRAQLDALNGAPSQAPAPAPASASDKARNAKAETALAGARSAYQDSDLKGAEARYREALQLDPGNAEALKGLDGLAAEAYHRDKDQPFDQAVAELYDAGMREMRKGRLVEARRKLDEARALNPLQPQLLLALDRVADGAAQQQGERDAQSLVLEGQRWAADGEDAKAAASFNRALQAAPGSAAAQAGLDAVLERNLAKVAASVAKGRAALAAKDWDAAAKAFELALSLDPAGHEAQAGLAQAKAQLEGCRSAAEQRREADRLYNAGVEAWQAGDLALAATRFRETLGVAPDDAEAAKSLAVLVKKLGERADKDRLDGGRLLEEGRTLEQRGALEEALRRYERALVKDPSLAEAEAARSSLEKRLKGL